jgi:hypothetical protein
MTSNELEKAIKQIRKYAIKPTPCPKCGKPCYWAPMAPRAFKNAIAAGFDGTCCHPWLTPMERA